MSRLEELTEDFGVTLKHMAEQSYKPMTNGDRIRSMNDEELADWFIMRDAIRKIDRDVFITGYSTPESILSRVNALTRIAWLNWLKQPAEVET